MSFTHENTGEIDMRVCKCGGQIRQHELTKNREAWTCNSCGRYEVIDRDKEINQARENKKSEKQQEIAEA